MQQHSKEWLAHRAQQILERNTLCNKPATSPENRATKQPSVSAVCCTKRRVFRYWLSGQESGLIMIAGYASVDEAEAAGRWSVVGTHKVCVTAGRKSCSIG